MKFADIKAYLKNSIPHPWWNVQRYVAMVASWHSWIALLLFCVLYDNCSYAVYDELTKKDEVKSWLQDSFVFIESHAIFNSLVVLLLAGIAFEMGLKFWQQRKLRWKSICIYIMCIALLYRDEYWLFAETIIGLDYKQYILSLAVLVMLSMMVPPLIRKYGIRETGENNTNSVHLSNDAANDGNRVDLTRQKYANTVCGELQNADISTAPLAVGVLGDWGSGKTTFLNIMKKQVEGWAFCVDFNPWNSQSPEFIIQDFFCSLNGKLSPYCADMTKSLVQYATVLSGMESPWGGLLAKFANRFLPKQENDLKDEIQNQLSSIGRPVVIFIDDLDRLDHNELFEVLRLVRNTAYFSNIIYVLAYDKEYLNGILSSKDIPNADKYIEKIVQLEFTLPSFSTNFIPLELYRRVAGIENNQTVLRSLYNKIFEKDYQTNKFRVCDYLPQIRDVHRFANLLSVNYKCIAPNELDMAQFFLLQLVQYSNVSLYDRLRFSPHDFLDTATDVAKGGLSFYKLKKDVDCGKEKFLIESLFPVLQGNAKSIAYCNQFDRYFTYGLDSDHVPVRIVERLLNDPSDKDLIKKCTSSSNRISSLFHHLQSLEVNGYSNEQVLGFVRLCFNIAFENQNISVCSLLYDQLKNVASKFSELHDPIADIFKKGCEVSSFRVQFAYILREFYAWDPLETQDPETAPLPLFSKSEIEGWAEENIRLYLSENNVTSFEDIMSNDKHFNKLLRASTCSFTDDDGNTGYLSLIYPALKRSFNEAKIQDFKKVVSKMFYIPEEYYEDDIEYKLDYICSVFGSLANYKEFVENYVDATNAEKQKHFKSMGI